MTPLRIAVHLTDNKPDAWVEGLRAALPGAQVEVWSPGMAATAVIKSTNVIVESG